MLKKEQAGHDAKGGQQVAGPRCGDNSGKHCRVVSKLVVCGATKSKHFSVASGITYRLAKRYGQVFHLVWRL
jgi:hypothetical protein